MKINILANETVNQIAAGEVAEKPAFIVKELVENAIDAEATRIRISLKEGGLKQIRIEDNGVGILKEDLPLAFLRHATSKIAAIDDLTRLSTLGFRGEALPSIAAVSRVTLRSFAKNGEGAYEIRYGDGALGTTEPVAANPGTEIIVDEIFYNTPARRKFLRSQIREMADITDLVGRLILSRPDIGFELLNDNRRVFLSPGNGQIRPAILSVYGAEAAQAMLRIGEEEEIGGYISHPSHHKPSRQYYNLFVNGRYIKSPELNRVVDGVYRHLLPERRYPIAVLYLTLDPKEFDVNVHPNKIEIKLEPHSNIEDRLYQALADTLTRAERSHPVKGANRLRSPEAESAFLGTDKAIGHESGTRASLAGSPSPGEDLPEETVAFAQDISAIMRQNTPEKCKRPETDNEMAVRGPKGGGEQESLSFGGGFYRNLRILGQLAGLFILAADGENLYIIDQHAAHERLLYNRLKAEAVKENESQPLLIPLELRLNHSQYLWILQRILDLKALGFILEEFGDNTFIIREAPAWSAWMDPAAFLKEMSDFWLQQKRKITNAEILDEKLMMKACKSAIKGNQYLADADMHHLLQSLDKEKDAMTCPHGRPITVKITVAEIRKWFLRS